MQKNNMNIIYVFNKKKTKFKKQNFILKNFYFK